MKPTFIGIGAQKCASSWLYEILAEHPDVCVSATKELNFFSFNFDHGYQWYERQFPESDNAACGEISPSYFCEIAVPERICTYAPEAKIILTLRDPVQRALSNHRHEVRVGHIAGSDLSFESGLKNNPMYVEQGLYASHLKRWLQCYPSDQLHIVFMDDIKADALMVARDTYRFLGIDSTYEPSGLSETFNRSYANRSAALASTKDILYTLSRSPALRWVWNMATRTGLRSLYRKFNKLESSEIIPEVRPETIAELKNRFYAEIRELESITGRQLTAWLQ